MLNMAQIPLGARISGTKAGCSHLACLEPGEFGRVRAVGGETRLRRRLLEMGFVSGAQVRVVRFAPLRDPIEVELHGYHISLRRAEAREILIDPV